MTHIVIIGCGIIGAAIAYELSLVSGLKITVLDKQEPAKEATSAALGVLMGAISQKTKGRAWQLRKLTMQRYQTLIPELETKLNRKIPFNRQGILMLCLPEDDLSKWEKLVKFREKEGLKLEIWDNNKLSDRCPQINCPEIKAAIYSPQDRQVEPVALTLALIEAAQKNGVEFYWNVTVENYQKNSDGKNTIIAKNIESNSQFPIDNCQFLIIAAGLGSLEKLPNRENWQTGIATFQKPGFLVSQKPGFLEKPGFSNVSLASKIDPQFKLIPVLGQGVQLRLESPLGNPDFQPVVTGDDVHIVPLGGGEYWVGATVEFPDARGEVVADESLLEGVIKRAIAFCPDLAQATEVKRWSGLRPRPQGQSAPVIGFLPGFNNVLLATGHYRNGILLAPATAVLARQMLINN
jgi:glycine/D-amino acid oxidase-like deaminating enzyme